MTVLFVLIYSLNGFIPTIAFYSYGLVFVKMVSRSILAVGFDKVLEH